MNNKEKGVCTVYKRRKEFFEKFYIFRLYYRDFKPNLRCGNKRVVSEISLIQGFKQKSVSYKSIQDSLSDFKVPDDVEFRRFLSHRFCFF